MKNFILIASTALFLFGCATVHREQPDTTHIAQQCTASSSISLVDEIKYKDSINEVVSYAYLPYAIAAFNTSDVLDPKENNGKHKKNKNFTLEKFQDGWTHKGRIIKDSGLLTDYYYRTKGDGKLEILIAFRGSRFLSLGDWYSNFSPVLSWIPIKDHYDLARESVAEILEEAQKQAQPKQISIITTGHSLGGGLAQHIAYAYPCTTAVVFNTSTVTNKKRLSNPYNPQIIHVRERGDELNAILAIIFPKKKSSEYHEYGVNLTEYGKIQHNSKRMSVSMARVIADCQRRLKEDGIKESKICPFDDKKARILYCESGYGVGERQSKICAKN